MQWAGALLSGNTLPLINKGGAPITLGQVAYEIACELKDVHKKLRNPKKSLRVRVLVFVSLSQRNPFSTISPVSPG